MPNKPNDQSLMLILKSYNNQAKELEKLEKLEKQFDWMLTFDL